MSTQHRGSILGMRTEERNVIHGILMTEVQLINFALGPWMCMNDLINLGHGCRKRRNPGGPWWLLVFTVARAGLGSQAPWESSSAKLKSSLVFTWKDGSAASEDRVSEMCNFWGSCVHTLIYHHHLFLRSYRLCLKNATRPANHLSHSSPYPGFRVRLSVSLEGRLVSALK